MMEYSVFDPTGNVTALVETPVEIARQPEAAAAILRAQPRVEQVGFVSIDPAAGAVSLRMAGGEFCGNAAMSAAALSCLAHGAPLPASVSLRVSGASTPVEVRLLRREGERFFAAVRMPPPKRISERVFTFEAQSGSLTVVQLEGISHILIGPESPFFSLLARPASAEEAVRRWCGELAAEGLGLLFLQGGRLTPLVFVPGSDTVFWETSCASGTAAAGMALSEKTDAAVDCAFLEPGGSLRVTGTPRETWLHGTTRRISKITDSESRFS